MAKMDVLAEALVRAMRGCAKARAEVMECRTRQAEAQQRYDQYAATMQGLQEQLDAEARREAEEVPVPTEPVPEPVPIRK